MTLPIIESLGGCRVLYLAILVNAVYSCDEGSCQCFFSVNTAASLPPGSDIRALCLEVWGTWQSLGQKGLTPSVEHMRNGEHTSALLSLWCCGSHWTQQHQVIMFWKHPVKKGKHPALRDPYHSGVVCSSHITLTSPGAQGRADFDIRSHRKRWCFLSAQTGVCADKSTPKLGLIQPISWLFSFRLLFISPRLSGVMTVSHNAGQREPGCSWAECWKACAITPAPLLRALQRWRDWEGEWWAFNTMHNRAPQPQTGTIFTLS